MVGKNWTALQPCKHQRCKAHDRLSQLPDDLLFLIMSSLTIKEAARTSVLSHRWNYLWRCFPVLIFEDDSTMERLFGREDSVPGERISFLRWVNRVLKAHLGHAIDELKVAFDLDKSCQSDIDRWVVFALAKQVKRLELDLTPAFGCPHSSLHKWCMSIYQPHNFTVFKSCLRSLSLKFVNVTTKDTNCLLRSCMVLENLCIESSRCLRYVRAFSSPLQLKHLEVSYCPRLISIDILAPKLLSFTHHGSPIVFHIRDASLLSEVSVGDRMFRGDVVTNVTNSLSNYFQQLEYLSWRMFFWVEQFEHFNLRFNNPPAMTNLKHLELAVCGKDEQSLFGWADLIEASPLLQRITVKFDIWSFCPCRRKIVRRNGRPLKSLKTLELIGDVGLRMDLEFATYVVNNSVMFRDLIVEFKQPNVIALRKYRNLEERVVELEKIVPQGAKLTIKVDGNQ